MKVLRREGVDDMYKIIQAEREAGREGKRFFDILSDKAIYGYAAQLAGYYLSFMDFIRYICSIFILCY